MLVVIVGAGPTGLTAANLLGLAGIQTLLLDRNAELCAYPRAISIDDEGLRICQSLGLYEAFMTHMHLNIQAHYLSHRRFLARVAPTGQENGYPLISAFHQPAFEAELLKGLKRFECVEVLFQYTVTGIKQDEQGISLAVQTATGEQRQIECAYVLACDGGKSTLRQALGIPLRAPLLHDLFARPYHTDAVGQVHTQERQRRKKLRSTQKWLVIDCSEDSDSSTEAIFFCNPARPAVTLSGAPGRRRWEFMLLPGDNEASLLKDETIYALIKQARSTQPSVPREIGQAKIMRKAIYTFYETLAATFAQGRVFLLGDAAHLMPPFGGQGMNSGLRDANNLCWKLAMVLHKQADPAILQTYQQERFPHVAQMIIFSSLLGKIIMPTARPVASLRDLFFLGINRLPAVRTWLSEMRVKPQPRYTQGFLLPISNSKGKKLTGRLLPQPDVLTIDGKRCKLDTMLGNGFALLRLYEKSAGILETTAETMGKRWSVRSVYVHSNDETMGEVVGDGVHIIDIEGKLTAFLGCDRNVSVLVRPDRYIMGVFQRRISTTPAKQ